MYFSNQIREDFTAAAACYDAYADVQARVLDHCVRTVEPHLFSGAAILDAGCGTGRLYAVQQQRRLGWQITGVDIAAGMCEHTRNLYGIPVLHADMSALPLADAAFDGVVSSLALQWVDRPATALKEIRRVLKPGGIAMVSTLVDGTLDELKHAFATVDAHAHVSDFESVKSLTGLCLESELHCLQIDQLTYREYYPNMVSIMQSLKRVGARNKRQDRKRGLTTPAALLRVENAYHQSFKTEEGLQLSWNIAYMLLKR